jgi:hypothetical protein
MINLSACNPINRKASNTHWRVRHVIATFKPRSGMDEWVSEAFFI